MALSDHPRVALTFGPSPVHRCHGLPSIWAVPRCGPSARTATAAWPSAATRCASWSTSPPRPWPPGATPWSRSVVFSPTTPGQVAATAAKLGLRCVLVQESWVDWPDAVYDRVGNILLSPADGRRRPAGAGRVRHRVQGELAAGARRHDRRRRQAVRHPGRRLGPPARRAGLRRLGGRGGAAGARARGLLRHRGRLLGHRQHPGRDDRGLRGLAAGARPRRVLGIDGSAKPCRDPGPGAADRAGTAAARRAEPGDRTTSMLDDRYHGGTYGIPDAATLDAMRLAAPARGDDHRPGLRGQVDGRAWSTWFARGEIGRDSTVLYAHLGGQPALNGYSAVLH